MNETATTRRDFLLRMARGTIYAAPALVTFTVAPDLMAQGGSFPGHMHHHGHMAPPAMPSDRTAPPPSEIHPPPGSKEK